MFKFSRGRGGARYIFNFQSLSLENTNDALGNVLLDEAPSEFDLAVGVLREDDEREEERWRNWEEREEREEREIERTTQETEEEIRGVRIEPERERERERGRERERERENGERRGKEVRNKSPQAHREPNTRNKVHLFVVQLTS